MKRVLLALFSLVLIAGVCFALGSAFGKIAFQGYLTDANGDALSGSYDLTITIYDALTGGNPLFAETHSGVTVTNGVFDLIIGEGTSVTSAQTGLFSGDIRYLGVTVGGTDLSPRTKLVSVPYAGAAKTVTGESVYVINNSATAIPIQAVNTSGIAIYARGGSAAGVVGTSEAANGFGLEGHGHGSGNSAGVMGQDHHAQGFGMIAKNVNSVAGDAGAALWVEGKLLMDTGSAYSCAGSGTISAGNSSTVISVAAGYSAPPVTADSLIFLSVYSTNAHSNGGVRVSAINASPPSFTVSTMDGNNVAAGTTITFWYLIVN